MQAFDELLLLKPGGRTIYFGPMGDNSQRLIDYFQAVPGVEPIKPRSVSQPLQGRWVSPKAGLGQPAKSTKPWGLMVSHDDVIRGAQPRQLHAGGEQAQV